MITDFLKTKRTQDDLKIALEIIREFKSNESTDEWAEIMFAAWSKLEQLEEFLSHLVEGKPLEQDTIAYMKRDRDDG